MNKSVKQPSKKQKITKDTLLVELLSDSKKIELLVKAGIPCVTCPIVGIEQNYLTVGAIAEFYGLDINKVLKVLNEDVDTLSSDYNNMVIIEHIHHSFIHIKIDDISFLVDPFKIPPLGIANRVSKAYLVFTHPHFDHYSPQDIKRLIKDGIEIIELIAPESMQNEVEKDFPELPARFLAIGQSTTLEDVTFTPVAAYNINKVNPSTGEFYHPKENNWVGYVVSFDKPYKVSLNAALSYAPEDVLNSIQTVYIAGDTDVIEEMQMLTGKIDIAFLPVSGTYVMTADEAVQAAKIIKPKAAVPIHYGVIVGTQEDAKHFINKVKQVL